MVNKRYNRWRMDTSIGTIFLYHFSVLSNRNIKSLQTIKKQIVQVHRHSTEIYPVNSNLSTNFFLFNLIFFQTCSL